MKASVEFHPAAVEEARAAREWYLERSAVAATAFDDELEAAIDSIAEAPLRWPAFEQGTRRRVLRRFPFSVVYRTSANDVVVVALMHWRRRPGYWRRR